MDLLTAFEVITQAINESSVDNKADLHVMMSKLSIALVPPVVSKKKVSIVGKRQKTSDTPVVTESVETHIKPKSSYDSTVLRVMDTEENPYVREQEKFEADKAAFLSSKQPKTDWIQVDVDNFIKAYDSKRYDHIRWEEIKKEVGERIAKHYGETDVYLLMPRDDEPPSESINSDLEVQSQESKPTTSTAMSPMDYDKMLEHFHALQELLQDRAPHLVELLEDIKIEASSL